MSMTKDLHNNIDERGALNIQAISTDTTTNGVIIDTAGYESIEFIIHTGTITDGTYTPLLQEDTAAGFGTATTVASDNTLGSLTALTAASDNVTLRVGCVPTKRYVRLSIVSASTTTGGTLGAVAVLGHPHNAPVAQ